MTAEDLFVEIDSESGLQKGRLKLCYRLEGNPTHPPVLMIMGLNSQLIYWPQPLVDKIVGAGYRVIRFDNRDSGRTEWLATPPIAYSLANMAKDATRLLDHLGITGKAHIVGASMGGMISQRLAIDHPERVLSLCSIMSTTGDLKVGGPEEGVYEELAKPIPPDPEEAIAHVFALFTLIGSKTYAAAEEPNRRALATAGYNRSLGHPGGGVRQVAAIATALDRTAALRTLTVPALVIHGNEDPLINISGGHATQQAIPGAVWYGHPQNGAEGMGHDMPLPLIDGVAAGILAHLERA
ncbi:alpha/beta fold hydrolase [Inquilinus sp.]|jgi:pimeloyl-ACP methyl ester carboxylesterase|uniref:alpha/beta fold hydrolase n=1 Tax=Inquilinus sp. TaxID=1932117 RepID=UPI0037835DA2